MSRAIAAAGPSARSQTTEANTPIVLVNGVLDPDLTVSSVVCQAPFDTRRAAVHLANRLAEGPAMLQHAEVTIAVPYALCDGEARWQVLLSGGVSGHEHDRSAGSHRDERVVHDHLSALLDEPAALMGPWSADGLSLGVVMSRLSARAGAELVFACGVEPDVVRVSASSSQADTIGRCLRPVFEAYGLALAQSLSFDRQRVRRSLAVVPERSGRRVALPWPDTRGRGGSVVSVAVDRAPRPPRLWTAQGDRPIVEDTFVLKQGWDPSRQGRPDSDYGRLTSSDFSRYGSVYRSWVLNEDGAYSDAPYHLGPAFDAGALFGQPGPLNQSLRLGTCLTLDSAGRRLSPVIESSTDGGTTWSAYPGRAEVMNDRAGVRLSDDELPSAVLSAAKAGTLRVRATASLTGPDRIEARRWQGNPFAGPAPTRTADVGGVYAWRTVAATSIHHDALQGGALQADTADDRLVLRLRLQEHLAQRPGPAVSARLDLAGAWTALRPGDLVSDALGRAVALDGNPSSFMTRDARIQRIDITFGVFGRPPLTRLRLD